METEKLWAVVLGAVVISLMFSTRGCVKHQNEIILKCIEKTGKTTDCKAAVIQ